MSIDNLPPQIKAVPTYGATPTPGVPAQAPVARDATAYAMPKSSVSVTKNLEAPTAPNSVTFAAPSAAGPSLAGYAPKTGSYNVSDNSSLIDVDSLSVSNVSSSTDRVKFTAKVAIDMPWPKSDENRSVTIDVTRTPGTNKVYVDMGSQGGFNGTVSFGKDGTMTITPNRDQGAGGVDRISIGKGGKPISIKVENLTGGQIAINASPA